MRKWHCELVAGRQTLQNIWFAGEHLQNQRFPKKAMPAILISKVRGVKELERYPLRRLIVAGSHYQ
jgi:hypothetical protein